jgi:predicted RNA-binding Zn-ribbon protein involved in translation (DUF1610 family)
MQVLMGPNDHYARTCPNCGEKLIGNDTGHFVPPSLGEEGFWICEAINELSSILDNMIKDKGG